MSVVGRMYPTIVQIRLLPTDYLGTILRCDNCPFSRLIRPILAGLTAAIVARWGLRCGVFHCLVGVKRIRSCP